MYEYILEINRTDGSWFLQVFETRAEAVDAQNSLDKDDIFGDIAFTLVYRRRAR